ncbi:putative SWI/SNF-related matrix-associated actin-dependent regulator of chromatin subfamily A member 3-like 1 [Rhododendron vialii]|uniref:putative SWI/SNF-related matrix-associated actin-dependent regulator of chromatin subfamily A member 3-like 1 n=1 Tax=Rhododendron vialii TaxID=182163 RepID=UPI00265EA12E|nr:putative SWI/SNF-related matrix-associated actin-dependent regulator of chromatin subfamily A member 3-like 1 [Rhododendron vialii]
MDEEGDPVNFFMTLDCWPQSPSQPPDDDTSETFMLGFTIANIVGLQYYSGRISGREMVGLVREPLNPYDTNAIKVLNTRTLQVGHIEQSVAKVLSPLIDENLISVEGIVPKTPNRGFRYKIPVQVHVFARREAFSFVQSAISLGGLQLISNEEAGFGLSEAVVVKERRSEDGRSLDDIFKLVDENVRRKGAMEVVEPPTEVIKSELFVHQKEALGWMVNRENGCELPPFWEERDGGYVNVLTNYQTDTRPQPIRGGIFADDMGLGKTLTLLSLIAFDRYGSGSVIPSSIDGGRVNVEQCEEIGEGNDGLVVSGSRKAKRGRESKNYSKSRKKRKTVDTHLEKMLERGTPTGSSVSKTTLIVCPPSVFSTWVTQLGEHTRPGRLKVYMYYGERTSDEEELQKYDIVLTTYSTLASEENWPDSPMKKIEWWRIILDEAHVIKNVNAQQSRAVTSLNAKRRWVVTGTPIQNGSVDLFSLMAFLRFEPFSIKSYWNSLVQRPLAQGNEKGLLRLQVLMATISLRRTKDKGLIGLPPKTVETCFVELSAEERELYDRMESEAKSVVRNYIHTGSVTRNYSTVLSILLRLRQICTDLALCPSDLKLLLPSNNIEDVSNNPELLTKLVSLLQDGEDLDCPICIAPPTDIVITCCAHIFCRSCILKTLKRTKPCCPLCRHPLSESDLFSSPPEPSDTDNSRASECITSSKVSALLKLLSASRDQNPSTKSVVFSQFRKMLILLEEPLKTAGFKILRLDGSMNAKRRAQAIQEFGLLAPDGPTVLLASLKASGVGINLTAASRVYLLEPWWNPAVEEQAMDRVHRIGQKEDVKIVRMIAQNSIEERILELQEKKKKLAREAFGRKGPKDRRDVSVDDLRTLMSL